MRFAAENNQRWSYFYEAMSGASHGITMLKWVADSEVESESVFEFGDVVIARLACVVGCMNADAEVEAEDEELEVVAQSEACADGEVAEEAAG